MARMDTRVAWIEFSREEPMTRSPVVTHEGTTQSIEPAACALGPSRARRLARAVQRGVTLVEVLIVVAIIAMVAGGVAVFALPKYKEAQITTAKTGARVIRNAVQQWQLSNNEYGSCPTVSQLVADRQLDAGQNTDDPWGMPFVITCSDDNVAVGSYGPDKKAGSKDDIMVPEGASAQGD